MGGGGPPELIAQGFERLAPVTTTVAGKPQSWLARRLVSRAVQSWPKPGSGDCALGWPTPRRR